MARQVAHDIKNPLTPIQLSAEHLRRVHRDRGQPLSPVLDSCVDTILTQVRLLRQIAGEFSSFASTPVPRAQVRPAVRELLREVMDAYTTGLAGRVAITLDVPDGLARRAGRPDAGRARGHQHRRERPARDAGGRNADRPGRVARRGPSPSRVSDTGVGMDDEAIDADLRALLLHQGHGHRAGAHDRQAQHRTARRARSRSPAARAPGTTVTSCRCPSGRTRRRPCRRPRPVGASGGERASRTVGCCLGGRRHAGPGAAERVGRSASAGRHGSRGAARVERACRQTRRTGRCRRARPASTAGWVAIAAMTIASRITCGRTEAPAGRSS